MLRWFGLLASAAMAPAMFTHAAAAQPAPLAGDAMAFGVREAAGSMDLSPDGRRVVYLGAGPGRYSVVLVGDLTTGEAKPIFKSDGNPESISWCAFATNERIVCRYVATRSDADLLINFGRLIALDADGSNVKELGQRSSAYDARIRQFDGSIIDWLRGDNESVLMTRDFIPEAGKVGSNIVRDDDGLGVVKINVRTLKTDTVERASKAASYFLSDGRGSVRLMAVAERSPEGQLTGRTRYQYRKAGSREWQMLVDFQEDEFVPLAVDASIDSLYALKKLDGRWALFRVRLDDSLAAELVASNPKVDIDDVIRFGDGERIIGYTYVDDRRRYVYFDPEFKKLSASLSKALPQLPLVDFVDASEDGQKILLFAGSDSDPGRYFLYDKTKRSMGEVAAVRPHLAKRQLAPVKPVTYPAADSAQIPAYLTLPVGSSGKGLPAVVLPHGGPEARDEWGFDWIAQFLAARGYAVIQPNYRGSAGYGDDWLMENGFKSWKTSISDVAASARWLVAEGIADPNRLAVVGWSYGGYAALQSAASNPSLFKAVAAIAPVTDLGLLKDDYRHYSNRRVVARYIGSGPHIAEGSPLRNAAGITAPVLLVHGDFDTNVGVAHSRKMNDALRGAGKASEFIEYKGLDHQLPDSEARTQMLLKLGELLDRTIGK